MRKLVLLILFISAYSVYSQTDSLHYARLDSMTPEELLQYYINEKEPPEFDKGPNIGDSLYYVLRPMAYPTQTVEADPLFLNRQRPAQETETEVLDTSSTADYKFRPKISLGAGRLSFVGDVYQKHFQPPAFGRPTSDIGISQRLTRYLQLDFCAMFGQLGANENTATRHENFQSEIRAGGLNLIYDFGNFIPDKYTVRPYVSLGVVGFEFLSKTDLKDKFGNTYYYWSDGTIKNMPEGSAGAQNAKLLVRDYKYESDIRELNKDGFGKYPERAWAFPIGTGFTMKVTNRVDVRFNFQYFVTTTDYIDGITNKSVGDRLGNKRRDNFTYTSVSLQYDLVAKSLKRKGADTLDPKFFLALDKTDSDNDGVPDLSDNCAGTPEGAKVDAKGCPLDEDNDGIPNYRDDELNTPPGVPVDSRGVAQSDEYWKNWYTAYRNDTLDPNMEKVVIGNIYEPEPVKKKKKKKANNDIFTVELARYNGAIPSDELAFLLSIGDINSTTLPDGSTVVYTTGSYDKLSTAVKRRDEFRQEGIKGSGISRVRGNEIIPVGDAELQDLLKSESEDLLKADPAAQDSGAVADPVEEAFHRNDVVYRVQLGAFKKRISTSVFNTSAGSVLELKTGESIYRYVTKGYKTIGEAAAVRADLVIQGYGDAFVTAYKDGKRIPLSQTAATVDKEFKEDLSEDKMFSSVNKKLVVFKVQLGQLKKKNFEASMDEKVKDLPNVEKQVTLTGSIRYTAGGNFENFEAAEKFRKDLEGQGFFDALVIATFKNEIISIQEANELLK
ncbi:MAG: hypothetical protein IT236_13330 [Bacteroidia bacterium]|nr:hypothetical protein [Bacteroidia bacterium]